jgi:multiple sugar transport system permease protein
MRDAVREDGLVAHSAVVTRATLLADAPRRSWIAAWAPALYLAPALAFLLVFVYLPAGAALALGFFHYHVLGVGTTFAGLSNFRDALTYPVFWMALRNTAVYAGLMVPATLVGAVAIALLIDGAGHYWAALRTAILLPYVMPVVATAIGWLWMYDPEYGLLNAALSLVHLPPSQWLLDPTMALPAVALYNLWHGLGFGVVVMLGALASLPAPVLEAAAIDGASRWNRFWRVTVPLVSPTLFFLAVVTTIATLQSFSPVYILTDGTGGPEYATETLLLLVYQTAFQYFHLSYAAAMALLLVVLIFAVTAVQRALAARWVFYQ